MAELRIHVIYGRNLVYFWHSYILAFVLGYVVYDTVEKEHDRLQRKQPGQFDHET